MGNVSTKVNDARIRKEVNEDAVVVYTKNRCSFCTRAKELLKKENIEYRNRNLDEEKQRSPDSYKEYVNGLVYTTHQTSVPQIFICGFTELASLRDAGKLFDTIAQCTGENSPKE